MCWERGEQERPVLCLLGVHFTAGAPEAKQVKLRRVKLVKLVMPALPPGPQEKAGGVLRREGGWWWQNRPFPTGWSETTHPIYHPNREAWGGGCQRISWGTHVPAWLRRACLSKSPHATKALEPREERTRPQTQYRQAKESEDGMRVPGHQFPGGGSGC